MAGVQSKGPVLNLKEMSGDLDQMIDMTHRQILIGKEQLRLKTERYAHLINKKHGNTNHQTTFGKDVVNPWDSRKDFDADAEECTKLKDAHEHIVPKELDADEVVNENRKFQATLRDEVAQRERRVKELKSELASIEADLAAKANELAKLTKTPERSLMRTRSLSDTSLKKNKMVKDDVKEYEKMNIGDNQTPDHDQDAPPVHNDENSKDDANSKEDANYRVKPVQEEGLETIKKWDEQVESLSKRLSEFVCQQSNGNVRPNNGNEELKRKIEIESQPGHMKISITF